MTGTVQEHVLTPYLSTIKCGDILLKKRKLLMRAQYFYAQSMDLGPILFGGKAENVP